MPKIVIMQVAMIMEDGDKSPEEQAELTREDVEYALRNYRQDDDGLLDFRIKVENCGETIHSSLA